MSDTLIIGAVRQRNDAPAATHYSTRGRGGWQEVADGDERDAIPPWRRWAGMAVMVLATTSTVAAGQYTLDADLTTWHGSAFRTVPDASYLTDGSDGNVACDTTGKLYTHLTAFGGWLPAFRSGSIAAAPTQGFGFLNDAFTQSYSFGSVDVANSALILGDANLSVRLAGSSYHQFGGIVADATGKLIAVPYSQSLFSFGTVKGLVSDGSGFGWREFPDPIAVFAGTGISVSLLDTTYTVAFDAASSPTLTGLTLSGATANTYARFNGTKALVSQVGVPVGDLTGVSSWGPTIASLVISGDLTVQGTHTTLDSTTVQVKDRVVQVNRTTGTAPAPVNLCGISVLRGNDGVSDRDPYGLFWDEANATWVLAKNTGGDDATLGADLALRVLSLRVSSLGTGIGHYSSTGVLTSSLIVDADVSGSAAIAITKLATGTGVFKSSGGVNSFASLVAADIPASLNATTFANITDSGLTASQYVKTDGSKVLVSAATIPIADVANTGGATGDLLVGTGATSLGRLAIGAAGTVLKGGTTPAWATIVNADVDAAAAIAGTKISPDFGSQNITTTGALLLGATPRASIGAVRLPSAIDGIAFRNAANSNDVVALFIDSGNNLGMGSSANGAKPAAIYFDVGSSGTHNWRVNGTAAVQIGATYVAIGSTVAASGLIRIPNAQTALVGRNAASSADIGMVSLNSSNEVTLGADAAGGNRAASAILDAVSFSILRVGGTSKIYATGTVNTLVNTTTDIQNGSGTSRVKVDATGIGFFAATTVAKQTSGANLTNNVTAGGTTDQVDNWTDLTIYANDAAAIRNAVYQLSKKLKQINDGLRSYGLFT